MEIWIYLGRLVLSIILGGLIGYERETEHKPAGLRTLTLVSLGSCLFMIISIRTAQGLENVDPTRIAAQVVTGIGFLGAGAILHARGAVYGLTTAVSIWLVAAIGLAAGAGLYIEAVVVALLGFIILRSAEKFWYKKHKQQNESVLDSDEDEK